MSKGGTPRDTELDGRCLATVSGGHVESQSPTSAEVEQLELDGRTPMILDELFNLIRIAPAIRKPPVGLYGFISAEGDCGYNSLSPAVVRTSRW